MGGGRTINTIMNGWFMWNPDAFPPSEDINPLYISFHISPRASEGMLTEKGVAHLKKFHPIGARDFSTMHMLQRHGIESYFSGCLTLTLGKKYKSLTRSSKVYIVEPYYDIGRKNGKTSIMSMAHIVSFALMHFSKVCKIAPKFIDESLVTRGHFYMLKRFLKAACFYQEYHKVFNDDILLEAEYITHVIAVNDIETNESLMQKAKGLILKYSEASLVITSRIHCGLPCLALETPVIFINSDTLANDSYRPAGRFEGISDLFNSLTYTSNGLKAQGDYLRDILAQGKISRKTIINNPLKYVSLRDRINEIVSNWLKDIYQ